MAIPIYNPQVPPPYKPSRRGIAGAEARAAGQLAGGVEQIGTAFAGRLFELANRNQANDAANKARDRWRSFWSDLQRDPEYADYGQKLDIFCSGLREELGKGIKFPGAKREIERQLGDLRQSWADSVQKLSDTRAIDHARTLSVQSINQAIQDRDIPRLRTLLAEARQTMQFEASDLAKIEDTAFREVIRDQTMDHARLLGEEGTAWLASSEAQEKFALQLGPQKRYSLDADTRQKMAEEYSGEREWAGKQQDDELDRTFADLHIAADNPEKADLALGQLAASEFYDGDKKYIWEQRFTALKANLEAARTVKPAVLEDWYKQNEDEMIGRLAIYKVQGMPVGTLRKIVEDAYYGRDKDGTGIPRIRGAFVKTAYEYLATKDDPAFVAGGKVIDDKTSGLDIKEKAEAHRLFLEWSKKNPDADEKTITQAAINIADPINQRNLDAWFLRTWAVVKGEERVKDELEQLTEDIQGGKYIGLSRPEYLARYNAALVKRAQADYPQENIASAYTDDTGKDSGTPGSAILVSAANRAYLYKLEGKTLTLWGRLQRRGGKYEWELIGKPGKAKAGPQLEKAATERAAREKAAAESEAEQKRRLEFARERQ